MSNEINIGKEVNILKKETKAQIKKVIKKAIHNKELSGLNLVVLNKGEEIYYHQDGYADKSGKQLITRDCIFRLYSMSKPITSAAMMILMERGDIDLYDPVSDFLPGFTDQIVDEAGRLVPVKRAMTIYELLTMTSGLVYGGDGLAGKGTEAIFKKIEDKVLSESESNSESLITTVEAMNALGKVPLSFHPGDRWEYGTSADVLGAVIEVVSGMTFGEFLKKELFIPLKMKDTGFWMNEEQTKRLATIYTEHNLAVFSDLKYPPKFESGGAGLNSTLDDYMNFATMLMNGGNFEDKQILKTETVNYMTSQILNEKQMEYFRNWNTLTGHSYGNLMRVVTEPNNGGMLTKKGEYGWDGWLGCYFANFPNEQVTFLLMMQKVDAGTTSLTRKIRNLLLGDGFMKGE